MGAVKNKTTARFVTGSIGRHVVIMTLTAAVGLTVLFLVDFADLYFLSLLGETAITSAIGFSGMLSFANMSISLGVGIPASALVARNIGANDITAAKRLATSSVAVSTFVPLLAFLGVQFFAADFLAFMGARGAAAGYGLTYLKTVSFGFPLLGASLAVSFTLRALGDAKRAMYVTLISAVGNGILDPIFIFGFDLSIQGAALATVIANLASLVVGVYGLQVKHKFLDRLSVSTIISDLGAIWQIAWPASLTQLATPFAIGYLTWITAPYGDEAVAGTAVINRLVPVAFGIVFALSGAVGPIVGQNFGAGNIARVRETIDKSLIFNAAYIAAVSVILWAISDELPKWFLAKGDAVVIISLFCSTLAFSWAFAGAQYVAQAAFNNLGKPKWSMWMNWGKATIGTIPFALFSVKIWGFIGIMIGYALGTVVFGIIATISVYAFLAKIEKQADS